MASYFDAQPVSSKDAPAGAEGAFGKMSLLSPQVTRILDDLGDEHSSSESNSDEGDVSDNRQTEEDDERGRASSKHDDGGLRKAKTSPLPAGSKKVHIKQSSRPGLGGGKHPHLARFHSLRSMLFSSNIETNMAKCREEEAQRHWQEEYEKRQGLNRPKTPPSPRGSPKGSPTKDSFPHRIGNTIRRMTSKESPTMKPIREDDMESTASDDEGPGAQDFEGGKKRDERVVSDDESIHHSDVEDLVRWVSRRDPPSDGEARRGRQKDDKAVLKDLGAHDSGHESLGHDDVDELVHWVSRRQSVPTEEVEQYLPTGYSDESTASDSEGDGKKEEKFNDEDVDDLVRWVSRKDGPNAGPVRGKKGAEKPAPANNGHDSDTAELLRWVTRHDETSGESDVDNSRLAPPQPHRQHDQKRRSITEDDTGMDELVRQVTKDPSNPKGTDSTHLAPPSKREAEKETLTHDDVDELVRWVSRRESNGGVGEKEEEQRDDDIMKWKTEEDEAEKKKKVGMSADHHGSLGHEDVDELVKWVSRKN